MNGISLGDDVLFVGRAQKKSEWEQELRRKFEQERMNRFEKSQRENLSLKNLDDSVDNEKLKEMFSEFGNVTSSKVIAKKWMQISFFIDVTFVYLITRPLIYMWKFMVNPQGISRGFGFVACLFHSWRSFIGTQSLMNTQSLINTHSLIYMWKFMVNTRLHPYVNQLASY